MTAYKSHYTEAELELINRKARQLANATSRQSRWQSWKEISFSTGLGFIGSFFITLTTLKFSPYSAEVNSWIITILCTVWSLGRGYAVRRWNNRRI